MTIKEIIQKLRRQTEYCTKEDLLKAADFLEELGDRCDELAADKGTYFRLYEALCIKVEADKKAKITQPEQEPEWYHGIDVYGCNRFYHKTEDRTSEFNTPLYTTPPQRKPLTDEEMFKIWLTVPAETKDRFAFARAIEAAHGIGDNT